MPEDILTEVGTEDEYDGVYSFSELSDEAKQRVIDDYAANVMNYEWWNFFYDYWGKDQLPDMGYEDAEIEFSGFGSQGDGASFTASVDVPKWIKAHGMESQFPVIAEALNKEMADIGAGIYRYSGGHYVHQNTIGATVDASFYGEDDAELGEQDLLVFVPDISSEAFDAEVLELEQALTEDARSVSMDIYKDLEHEYDYQVSEEHVAEMSDANEWKYDEEGNMV